MAICGKDDFSEVSIQKRVANIVIETMDNNSMSDDHPDFKTKVTVSSVRYKDEDLITRSQAKRVLSRFDRFREVVLDFKGVTSIGQAFADEIFRVYKQTHPEVIVVTINTTPDVDKMISREKSVDNAPGVPKATEHND